MPTFRQTNIRSPYLIDATGTAGQEAKVELFIWNNSGSEPASPTKTLTKPIPSTNIITVHFDVSPYMREYINQEEFTPVTVTTDADEDSFIFARVKVWVNGLVVDNEYLLGLDGFGYFEEGKNPTGQPPLLTEGEYYVQEGGNTGGLYFFNDDSSTWQAEYTSLDGTTPTVTSLFNSITSPVTYVPYITPTHVGTGGSIVKILKDSVEKFSYTFREVCEPKYIPVTCDFINKHGSWQRLVFFKVSKSTMQMENTEYHLMPASVDYSTSQNIQQTFNTNGTESIKVNTGWVPESYSEVMKELVFSETIRLDNRPVNIKTKSIDLFKSINEKNINYTMEFDYANHMINYVQ